MDDRNLITLAQFSAHLNCASKTHLLVTGQTAPSSYFVDTEALIARSYRKEALQHLQEATPAVEPIAFSEISRDIRGQAIRYVDCSTITYCGQQSTREQKHNAARKSAPWRGYAPVLFCASDKPDRSFNLILCFAALAIWQVLGKLPEIGKLVHGPSYHSRTVRIADYVVRTQQLINEITLIPR